MTKKKNEGGGEGIDGYKLFIFVDGVISFAISLVNNDVLTF